MMCSRYFVAARKERQVKLFHAVAEKFRILSDILELKESNAIDKHKKQKQEVCVRRSSRKTTNGIVQNEHKMLDTYDNVVENVSDSMFSVQLLKVIGVIVKLERDLGTNIGSLHEQRAKILLRKGPVNFKKLNENSLLILSELRKISTHVSLKELAVYLRYIIQKVAKS